MEYADYLRFAFALLFVVGLIGGVALLARRFGLAPGSATGSRNTQKRLEIVETLALDTKRRVMIIRRDGIQHLILLGTDKEQVLETGFTGPSLLATANDTQAAPEPASVEPHTASRPTEDDDVFARLRKVAELMNEKRALVLRTGHTAAHKNSHTAKHKAPQAASRRAAGGRA